MQHPVHVRLAVRACNHIDTPRLIQRTVKNRDVDLPTSTNISYLQRSPSCTHLRLDQHQLPATIAQLHTSTTRPTSATCNDRPTAHIYDSTNISYQQRSPSCTHLRLDQHQLPATIAQLHTSTTRPTSATSNDRPAAHIYDSTNISYQQRSPSCTHLRLDQHQLPATIAQLHTSTTRPTSATCNDRPAAHIYDSTNISYQQRSPSCTHLRLDQHQLPATIAQLRTSTTRPTSATSNDRPAAHIYDSTNISYQQRSPSCTHLRLDQHQLPATIAQLHTSTTRPTSATSNDRPAAHIYDSTNISYPQRSPSCTHLRLDQHQLPATIAQLHTSTTRPTSATSNDRPAAHIYDSTNISYLQRSPSCTHLRLDQHQLPATIAQLHTSTTRPTSATSNDRPAAHIYDSTNISYQQRSPSCTHLRLDQHQLPATIAQLHTSTTRPTSATSNDRPAAHIYDSTNISYQQRSPSCTHLRLDQHQLPATIAQLHTSTTRPTSATSNDRPAAHIYDSTNISYLQRSPSCTHLRLDQHQLPATIAQLRTSTTRPTSATSNDRPAAHIYDSTNISYQQRSPSCTHLRLDQHQLPATIAQLHTSTTRPTSATSNDRPAAHIYDSTNISYQQRSPSCTHLRLDQHQLPATIAQLHTSTTRPTSATSNDRPAAHIYDSTNISYQQRSPSCTHLRLDQHQLPATIAQLHTSTTRPTSATRNDRPAAHIYDSTNISYQQRSPSCTHLRLDQHQLPATIAQLHTSTTRPTSATSNDRPAAHIYDSTNISYQQRSPSCTHLRLDQHQLPATIAQLHTSTTRPTSATRNDRPAAHIYDSTNISYQQRSPSCTHLRLDQHQLPATIAQLHTSTTRPTSATRNDRPAAHIYDSTNISYQQLWFSCFSSTRPYQLPTSPIKLNSQIQLPRTLHTRL